MKPLNPALTSALESSGQQITFYTESRASLVLSASNELCEVLTLATKIHEATRENFNFSFTTLLIGIAMGQNDVSHWIGEYFSNARISIENILKSQNFPSSIQEISRALNNAIETIKTNAPGQYTVTQSAFTWLKSAQSKCYEQKHNVVKLSHLLGALIFTPGLHDDYLTSWDINRKEWAYAFVDFIQAKHREEWEFWRETAERVFPQIPAPTPGVRRTFLLTWDPERFPFSRLSQLAQVIESKGEAIEDWNIGRNHTVSIGDLVFLMRQNSPPLGLVGVGEIAGESRIGSHWDESLRQSGRTSNYAPIRWRMLTEKPVVDLATLKEKTGETQIWERYGSGFFVKPETAKIIKELWPTPSALPQSEPSTTGQKTKPQPDPKNIPPQRNRLNPSNLFGDLLPRISNDGLDSEPLWDIRADVQSIAQVMCMRQVEPPLSIALFGHWGSGKSFFMRQLRKQVELIKRNSNDQRFHREIVQIEFNAWHYVESNLWASLVCHIFESLKNSTSASGENLEPKIDGLIERLGIVRQGRQQAEQQLATARANESAAQNELFRRQNEAQLKTLEFQQISSISPIKGDWKPQEAAKEARKALQLLGLQSTLESAEDIARALRELKHFESKWAAFLRAFWMGPDIDRRLIYLGLTVLLTLFTPLAVSLVYQIGQFSQFKDLVTLLTGIVTPVAALIKPILNVKAKAESALNSIQKANQDFDNAVTLQKNEIAKTTLAAKSVYDRATQEVKNAEKNLEAAKTAVSRAFAAVEAASPRRILNLFIEERSTSDDYRKSMGTLALVRRDFEKLSKLMRDVRNFNSGKLSKEKGLTEEDIERLNQLPHIDRIILYIDDLDRCPPKQVIEVLQAIHLLLAFDLFVVVVGVDPRWIRRSLTQYYPELLLEEVGTALEINHNNIPSGTKTNPQATSLDHVARPIDYLEKIFQIPFWIKPLGDKDAGLLINALVSPTPEDSPNKQPTPIVEPKKVETEKPAANSSGSSEPAPNLPPTSPNPSAPNPAESSSKTSNLKATKQETGNGNTGVLTQDEINYISGLQRLAGTTPRAIKRMVNIYRLLRARVSKENETDFIGAPNEPREFEAVLHLLALFNSAPQLALRFCQELDHVATEERLKNQAVAANDPLGQPLQTPLRDLLDRLPDSSELSESENTQLNALRTYAMRFTATSPQLNIDAFYRWREVISRYSFVGQVTDQLAKSNNPSNLGTNRI